MTLLPASRQTLNRQSLGLGLIALLLFLAGVYQQAAIGFDSRFVLFAQEMLRHGPGFFPTTYGEPYPDYSAFSTFLVWLFALPFGTVNALAAWLPSALAAAWIVVLMYRLVAPYSPRWALLSIALLLLSNTFITETRAVSLDLMLAAVGLSVFYLGYATEHFATPKRTLWILALLVLGFAIRGPIGLVIPTGMLCSFYLLGGQWRRLLVFGFQALALLVACIGLLLWLAWLDGGSFFLSEVIRMQFTGRMDGSEGSSGVLYYFSSSFGNYALAYPLAVLVVAALLANGRQQRGPALRLVLYCLAAGLIVMLGLSVPQAKKARYILPMLPLVAIVAAFPFQVNQGRLFAWLRGLIQGIWLILPGLLIAGMIMLHRRFPEDLPTLGLAPWLAGVLQIIAVIMLFKARWRALGLAGCAVLALWASYILVIEPVERTAYDTRTFTRAARQLIQHDPAPVVLHAMGKDAKAIKFMVNLDEDLQPVFTGTAQQLQAVTGPAWLVMDKQDYQKLQGSPIGALGPVLSGRFDKNDFVLLKLP
ncbi:ArnT family glycosyltransferase [Pseudomonas gingeri]|uniref:ArnT family glycosyltransferase n=1 Tax=Pseudomonas gingeri TaxID=117681 RepID=UPI0015A4BA7D|nr:glycosyltransferase family 39 protein [Pseudomonas gingeri]NWE36485.1 glycosyltransferase family 39 protein [Pseudomonas gingeri]NWE57050.1 glycosyltransferase family 39 protein [Pseudomonas gingeri]NWF00719.1 glycosyltransferase family 39 protein [Pseudomonas gingeri]